MPNLILFGAGASYGSQRNDRPPLGNQLFADLRKFDPTGWGSITGVLAKSFEIDFETGMGYLPGEAFQTFQLKLAEYLFGFEPSNGNLYRKLAKRLRTFKKNKGHLWDGSLITLNYDRLLQLAFEREFVKFSLLPQVDTYELCAVHGLCNLFSSTTPDRVPILIKDPSASVRDTNPDRAHTLVATKAEFERACSLAPIMSFYERAKRSSTHPEWLEARRKRFADLTTKAERIAIVGVSVQEQDIHIWQPLASSPAKMLYCSLDVNGFQIWRRCRTRNDDELAVGEFADQFDHILSFLGLC